MDLPGIAPAVLAAQAGHGGVFGGVAVFHPLLGFGPGAGAEIGADVGLGAELLDVVEELVGAEAVGFDGAPGHFEAGRALVAGADAVRPVVVGGEVAAGPAEQGDVELADGFEDVLAEAVGIGEGRLLFEDAAIDAAAEVLDEVAVELGIDVADDALGIDLDARAEGGRLAAQNVGGRRRGSSAKLRRESFMISPASDCGDYGSAPTRGHPFSQSMVEIWREERPVVPW